MSIKNMYVIDPSSLNGDTFKTNLHFIISADNKGWVCETIGDGFKKRISKSSDVNTKENAEDALNHLKESYPNDKFILMATIDYDDSMTWNTTSTPSINGFSITMGERIVSAAIYFVIKSDNPVFDGRTMILCGPHHGSIFQTLKETGLSYNRESHIQGFWTDHSRFVNRLEACRIVKKAHQFRNPENEKLDDYEIFSEDIDMQPTTIYTI